VEKGIARSKLGFNGNRIILFVGRIIPLKGMDKLLVAMTYLKKRESLNTKSYPTFTALRICALFHTHRLPEV
jgi:glycosyltransferase involved in cell wall biosynthesis